MRNSKRWLQAPGSRLLVGIGVGLTLLILARIATAQTVVSVGAVAPEDTPWHKQLMKYKTDLEKAAGGAVKVKMFMGGAKGGEDALVRQCAQGSLQMVGVTTG